MGNKCTSHVSNTFILCILCLVTRFIDAAPPPRIVGGSDVPVDSYPWFVKFNGCGGVLISPEFVLTAG